MQPFASVDADATDQATTTCEALPHRAAAGPELRV